MNTLTLKVSRDNWHGGPTYELVIDGRSLSDWLDDLNEGIPFWMAKQGLPVWRTRDDDTDRGGRIVTVCGCGEVGCGHSRCTIRSDGDTVIFEDFAGDAERTAPKLRFVFPRDQYEAFCKTISEQSAQYKGEK